MNSLTTLLKICFKCSSVRTTTSKECIYINVYTYFQQVKFGSMAPFWDFPALPCALLRPSSRGKPKTGRSSRKPPKTTIPGRPPARGMSTIKTFHWLAPLGAQLVKQAPHIQRLCPRRSGMGSIPPLALSPLFPMFSVHSSAVLSE